ncbi:MAG: hypothetical protein FK732_05760, partial [Asgard group archaeon]|nr:hypothetical protein [Asgard group archaeon]
MNRSYFKQYHFLFISVLLLGTLSMSTFILAASETRQTFVVSNETKVLLDISSDVLYNGSISITVTSGDAINATVNEITEEISLDETKELFILNTSSIYFSIFSDGYSEGYFDVLLN